MDLTKSYDFFKPEMVTSRIHIIGCGSVGSTVAENLARYGLTKITLYDFDIVTPHNIVNQMFNQDDIGRPKVDAVADMLIRINPEIKNDLRLVPQGFTNQKLSGYVFLCVDNIDLRREIASSNRDNHFVKAMFDFRTRLTDAQHYAADWSDPAMVQAFLNSMEFSHDEAEKETPMSACRISLSVCSTIRTIVSCGVANFVNFVRGLPIKKLILADAFSFQIDAF